MPKGPKKDTTKLTLKQKTVVKLQDARARLGAYMAKRPHRTFRLTRWRGKPGGKPAAGIVDLIFGSLRLIWQEKRLLLGLTLLYAVVSFVVVGGISQIDFVELRQASLEVFTGGVDAIGRAFTLFEATTSGLLGQPLSELQQALAALVAVLFWLMLVWALRMRFAKQEVKLRDALYNSGAPLISTVLVGLVVALQALPGAIGVFVLLTAQQIGALQTGVEYMLFAVAALLLCLLSLYWLVSSLLAIVVVTLPNMYPWRALSAASELVIGQRWRLVSRVVILALVVFAVWVVVLVPALMFDYWLKVDWLPIIPVIYQLLGAFTLTYCTVYVYRLYRSLL